MWGSSIEGKGRKRKGINKGEFFLPYTEESVFLSSVSLLYFFSFYLFALGDYKGVLPFIVRGYEGVFSPL